MAIAVSTLLNARDKARQGATISDMRNLSTAIEAYSVDYSFPPATMAFSQVARLLEPYNNHSVPVVDHWGHNYDYTRTGHQGYSLVSFGKDGVDGADLTPETRSEFNRDITMIDGKFPGL